MRRSTRHPVQRASTQPAERKKGDSSRPRTTISFEELYQETKPSVLRMLSLMGILPLADREDLAHDIIITVYQHLSSYDGETKLETWVSGFAWRIVQSRARRAANQREILASDELFNAVVDRAPNPEQHLSSVERDELFAEVLAAIPEDLRIVLVMKDLQGHAMIDIARVLDIKERVGWNRLRDARQQFVKVVKKLRKERRNLLGASCFATTSVSEETIEAFFRGERDRAAGLPKPRVSPIANLGLGLLTMGAAVGTIGDDLPRLPPSRPPLVARMAVDALAAAHRAVTLQDLLHEAAMHREPAFAVPQEPVTSQLAARADKAGRSAVKPQGIIENAILQRAQRLLFEGHPENALRQVESMTKRLPQRRLDEEREVVRIRALTALGRRKEAGERFERFRETYPSSPHLPTLQETLMGAGEPL